MWGLEGVVVIQSCSEALQTALNEGALVAVIQQSAENRGWLTGVGVEWRSRSTSTTVMALYDFGFVSGRVANTSGGIVVLGSYDRIGMIDTIARSDQKKRWNSVMENKFGIKCRS